MGRLIGRAEAVDARPDLSEAGIGDGGYGYRIVFDARLRRDDLTAIEVRAVGSLAPLPIIRIDGSSAADEDTHASPSHAIDQALPATLGGAPTVNAMHVEGYVDSLSRTAARGWAWRPAAPDDVLEIQAEVDGKIVATALADEFRPDLLQHGKGAGRYGFTLNYRLPARDDVKLSVRAKIQVADGLGGSTELPPVTATDRRTGAAGSLDELLADHHRFTHPGPEFEEYDPDILDRAGNRDSAKQPLVLAFYLPQFHSIPENDRHWGKGFTEWRQLARALPRFPGHYQPRIPRDLGFYTLDGVDTLRRQAQMAKSAGIGAFAYYYYWFDGKRVLERPLDSLLASDVDMPFLLIWANENWTRTWDGSESQVLLRQNYAAEDELALLEDFARHMRDPRYVKLDGRPLFIIYNPDNIPDTSATIARWRRRLNVEFGLTPLMFMAQTFHARDPRNYGMDGAIEFPPHKLAQSYFVRPASDAYSNTYQGSIVPYDQLVEASLTEKPSPFPLIKTLVPSWDNDARRPNRGLTLEGIAPSKYQAWLHALIGRAMREPVFGRAVVAINAWNEWAEAAYIEPDVYYGSAFLNATARALVAAAADPLPPHGASRDPSGSDPKVSVILPNFNHENFLAERIRSIVQQTRPPDEIIFLDDCSRDGSVELATRLLEQSGISFRVVTNKTNSGSVFRQWIKGLELAVHDVIWIAETDDSADPHFLERVLQPMQREYIMVSYGRMSYIDEDGRELPALNSYYDGLQDFSWDSSFTISAHRAFRHDFSVKNVIPNVSGCVFRKPVLSAREVDRLYEYRFAGDWYFYALLVRGGSISYRRDARAYFRLVQSSTSRTRLLTDQHLVEHRMVLEDLSRLYPLPAATVQAHARALTPFFPTRTVEALLSDLTPAALDPMTGQPLRLCIAAYSFDVGGGEVLPVELANTLKSRGHHVTYLIFEGLNEKSAARSIRGRLRRDIPVVYWKDIEGDIDAFVRDMGIQVFNSHNVTFEHKLGQKNKDISFPYIASLHGGYETIPDLLTDGLMSFISRNVDAWLYLSQKNLAPFEGRITSEAPRIRSFNAIRQSGHEWIDREEFRKAQGIPTDAFVAVICSRAIAEKGWATAIEVCRSADRNEARPIYLALIGDGPAATDLRTRYGADERVRFFGFIDDPLRYLRCFDLGIFPSTYSGETFPLFLLECFHAGLPTLSTDIGEIPYLVKGDAEGVPGITVSHVLDPNAMIEEMSAQLSRIMEDHACYERMRAAAGRASKQFSLDNLAEKYERVFASVLAADAPVSAADPTA